MGTMTQDRNGQIFWHCKRKILISNCFLVSNFDFWASVTSLTCPISWTREKMKMKSADWVRFLVLILLGSYWLSLLQFASVIVLEHSHPNPPLAWHFPHQHNCFWVTGSILVVYAKRQKEITNEITFQISTYSRTLRNRRLPSCSKK